MSMSRAGDGGAAFPGEKLVNVAGYVTKEREPVPGMTLRDYFAAKAMQGLIAGSGVDANYAEKSVASLAYMMADVMLEARKQ